MKALRNFSRIFIGLVFIYSGFVKVIDPLGFAYKFNDYFVALNLEFLSGGALVFAVLMSVAELLIGIALTFNLLPKIVSWAVLLFMALFTPLTLWLAITNAVSDCGCFGDAVVLSNWETFFKNVIIDVFVIIIFIERKKFKPKYPLLFQWALGIIFAIASFTLAIHCLRNLPIIDFRPYHIGANIREGMTIPESEKDNKDIIESTFIYEKNGKKENFTADNLPDASWTFVDVKHKVIKEGYKPPIHDFTIEPIYIPGNSPEREQDSYVNLFDIEFIFHKDDIFESFSIDMLPDNTWSFQEIVADEDMNIDLSSIKLLYLSPDDNEEYFTINNLPSNEYIFLDAEYTVENTNFKAFYGDDITPYVMESKNYVFIAVMTYVEDASTKNIDKLNDIAAFCMDQGYDFYCLTGSNDVEIKKFINDNNIIFNFYNTDPTTLKTIIRSNPGLLLLKEGTILNKWAHKNLPEIKDLQDNLESSSISKIDAEKENNLAIIFILALFLFMSLFHNIYNWLIKNKFVLK